MGNAYVKEDDKKLIFAHLKSAYQAQQLWFSGQIGEKEWKKDFPESSIAESFIWMSAEGKKNRSDYLSSLAKLHGQQTGELKLNKVSVPGKEGSLYMCLYDVWTRSGEKIEAKTVSLILLKQKDSFVWISLHETLLSDDIINATYKEIFAEATRAVTSSMMKSLSRSQGGVSLVSTLGRTLGIAPSQVGGGDFDTISGLPTIDHSKISIGRPLGSGTFGEVFAAQISQTPCAVKMLHQQEKLTPEQNDQLMQDIENEIAALCTAAHPNIIRFMGISRSPTGRLMIVTEKMTTDLYSLLVNDKSQWFRNKFSLVTRIGFGRDAALAMAWLHGRQPVYLHLDLKPANILVDPVTKVVKVCDFGGTIIKVAQSSDSGLITGTPQYMAPEMLNGENFDEKADVYSMSLTLYEILFQKPAWASLSVPRINTRVLKGQRPVLEEKFIEGDSTIPVSSRIKGVIESSWDQDPVKRIDMSAIVKELDQAILETAIDKPLGRKFWEQEFERATKADWKKFWNACKRCYPPSSQHPEIRYEEGLRNVLDPKRRGIVVIEMFGKFLEWFGPLDSGVYQRVLDVLTHPSFVDMNKHDAQMALKTRVSAESPASPGYYCTRVSSEAGYFAISLVKSSGIAHHRVKYDCDAKQFFYNKVPYNSFTEVIEKNNKSLTHPLEGYEDKKYSFLLSDTPDKRPVSNNANYYENPDYDHLAMKKN